VYKAKMNISYKVENFIYLLFKFYFYILNYTSFAFPLYLIIVSIILEIYFTSSSSIDEIIVYQQKIIV